MADEKTVVTLAIHTELGCDPLDGEYAVYFVSSTNALTLSRRDDDFGLLLDAIENDLDFSSLPEEGCVQVQLVEDGEWEDVFFINTSKLSRFWW